MKCFFSFSNSFFICLFLYFCLFIPLCYFSFVLISQVFVIPGEYLPNSSCHFRHRKSVFLQILHHLSVSWEITLLYCFRSKFIYFAQKVPINAKKLRCAQVKIHQILVVFENDFYSNFIYLEQKSISKCNFKSFECFCEFRQIRYVIYHTTSHFSFKVCIDLQYDEA